MSEIQSFSKRQSAAKVGLTVWAITAVVTGGAVAVGVGGLLGLALGVAFGLACGYLAGDAFYRRAAR